MRVLEQNDPLHPDNEGWVVSHIGLQQDARWDDFQRFDKEDQALFREIVEGTDPGPREREPGERRRIRPNMRVIDEVLDQLVTRDFLDKNDAGAVDAILAEMSRTLGVDPHELGLSREELAGRVARVRRRQQIEPRERPVQPQDHRRELRGRLNETARSVGARILEALQLSPTGVDIIRRMPELSSAHNNIAAVSRLMHRQVNTSMGFSPNTRREAKATELEEAIERLDEFGDLVQDLVRSRLGDSNA